MADLVVDVITFPLRPRPRPRRLAEAPRLSSCWPPPTSCADPEPQPRFTALRRLFDFLYLTMPPETWDLPSRQQSDAVLRRAAAVCRNLLVPSPGLDYLALDPVHEGEYWVLVALARVDIEELIAGIARDDPADFFPAAAYDPDDRCGRRGGRVLYRHDFEPPAAPLHNE
jgi:hypothetical protein